MLTVLSALLFVHRTTYSWKRLAGASGCSKPKIETVDVEQIDRPESAPNDDDIQPHPLGFPGDYSTTPLRWEKLWEKPCGRYASFYFSHPGVVRISIPDHGLQFTAFVLPKRSSSAKIDGLPGNHLEKAAVIFGRHITEGFYVNHVVAAPLGAPLARGESLVSHLGVQSPESKLRMASRPNVSIAHEMAVVISHCHGPLPGSVQ